MKKVIQMNNKRMLMSNFNKILAKKKKILKGNYNKKPAMRMRWILNNKVKSLSSLNLIMKIWKMNNNIKSLNRNKKQFKRKKAKRTKNSMIMTGSMDKAKINKMKKKINKKWTLKKISVSMENNLMKMMKTLKVMQMSSINKSSNNSKNSLETNKSTLKRLKVKNSKIKNKAKTQTNILRIILIISEKYNLTIKKYKKNNNQKLISTIKLIDWKEKLQDKKTGS